MKRSILIPLFFLLGFSVYFQSLLNGFVWDDEGQVVQNSIVHSPTNIPRFFTGSTFDPGGSGWMHGIYYKPLMPLFFSLIYAGFGSDPFFFHLFGVMLHIANTILVFFLFRTFFKPEIASILALIFLIHPIQVEAVAYVSALQDALFFSFGIAALLLSRMKQNLLRFTFVSLLFLGSLLSKETGVLFVAMVALYHVLWQRTYVPRFLLAGLSAVAVYLYLRLVLANVAFQSVPYLPISKATLLERIISMPKIFAYYMQSFFFPKDLVIAQHWVVRSITFEDFFLPFFLTIVSLLAVAALGSFVWRNRNKNYQNSLVFFCLWFLLGMGMHLQIFPLSMTVADRWFYFPMVGLLGVFGVGIEQIGSVFGKRILVNPIARIALLLSIILIIMPLSLRAVIRINDWRDNLTLYSHDINIMKDSFDIENGLGVELYKMGKIEEAKMHFEKSVSLVALPVNLTNLGIVYKKEGDTKRAREYFEKALAIEGGSYVTYESLADLLLTNDSPSATKLFVKKALTIFPNNPRLWMTLALAEHKLGDEEEATQAASRSFELMTNEDYMFLLKEVHIQ